MASDWMPNSAHCLHASTGNSPTRSRATNPSLSDDANSTIESLKSSWSAVHEKSISPVLLRRPQNVRCRPHIRRS